MGAFFVLSKRTIWPVGGFSRFRVTNGQDVAGDNIFAISTITPNA